MTNLLPLVLMKAADDLALTPSDSVSPKTFWLPEGASTIAPESDWIFNFINYINYFFFVLVIAIMVYFVVKYRQRGREVYARGPAHNTVLEVTWTIIPTIIVVVIFFQGFRGFVSMKTIPDNAYQIDVTASQWNWSFKYPNGATDDNLWVPAGRPVKLVMRSQDVLHSLFIPDFRVKQDVVPGRYTTLWFQADEPTAEGDFHMLFCTEFCGKDHSRMNREVHVLEETAFNDKIEEFGRWLDEIPEDELYSKAGPKLYKRCASCHTLDGSVGTGPSWGNYDGTGDIWARTAGASSQHKIDGKPISEIIGQGKEFETPEGYLRNSILNPGKHIVDGYGNVMPTFQGQLNDKAIDALIGMMKHLDEFNAKGEFTGAAGN